MHLCACLDRPSCVFLHDPISFVALQEPDLRACTELRHVLCGGEMMPPAIVARFQQILPHAFIHNVYGPTETTVMGTGTPAILMLQRSYMLFC